MVTETAKQFCDDGDAEKLISFGAEDHAGDYHCSEVVELGVFWSLAMLGCMVISSLTRAAIGFYVFLAKALGGTA